ncbi:DDB1- and CUL4-associated factor 5 [Wallemia ichthyophaga EXF-994]|uniref:DDB1-and CUL4-associated factor 5 n=1 Tax=Wallemia ichthyophaga (strain EXF-994 / CBS 113033) TaxID=1299270 RepID=R9ABC3_WALI9|nr:DDB1- and CUL4-associated factor 5 [Wallemia ichthyophaga EXF-994]EOQ99354.1 DDB1- and CUL4-associated factor 5 [Wallemia ichthyophaga EXF-994]
MKLPGFECDFFKNGLGYSNSLKAHTGCVNAVSYSKTNGSRLMATGGDCTNIYIWDLYRDIEDAIPIGAFSGPTKNIFTLEFNSTDSILYCGSNDSVIYKYDLGGGIGESLRHPRAPSDRLDHLDEIDQIRKQSPSLRQISHASSLSQISAHPTHPSLILSASSDDELQLTDERVDRGANIATFHTQSEWRDVKWHPTSDHLFGCCDSLGGVYLNDIRKGFDGYNMSDGAFTVSTNPFVRSVAVMQYSGTLTLTNAHIHAAKEGLRHRRLDSSSMSFNNTGDLFGVVYQHAYPTIYSIREQNPLAVLTGDYTPQGERVQRREDTYSTACTTKHCSFQGDYLATGSDDFRGYVWKVPPRTTMMDRRRVMSREEMDEGGFATANGYAYDVRSAFSSGASASASDSTAPETICLPALIDRPAFRLEGHASIVNSAMIHPSLPLIATSGVEKSVKVHTPTPFSNKLHKIPALDKRTPPSRQMGDETGSSRRDFLLALLSSPEDSHDADIEEDPITINFFDSLLRRDREVDIWNDDEDDEDDKDDQDDQDNDQDDDMDDDGLSAPLSEDSIDIDELYPV